MPKTHHDLHAADARRALDAYISDATKDLGANIGDLIADIGHLCAAEHVDFLAALSAGIRRWAIERVNPGDTRPAPTVEITITVHGLAPSAKRGTRRSARPKKSRGARAGPSGT